MSLRQQIIQDRIDETSKILGITDKDHAFLRLAYSIILGESLHTFDPKDLVEGGQDKQIDVVTIEEVLEEATVYIIQSKNVDSFSSNALIQMRNGLNWLFKRQQSDLQTLSNTRFRDKIHEYRSTQRSVAPSNIRIVVSFVTHGLTSDISEEFKQEAKGIMNEYNNGTFESFEFRAWGCDELVEQINSAEKKDKKIDADITVRYDANNPSLIKFFSPGLKGMVCSASGNEIARIVNADKAGYVFDSNIRKFLGSRGAVNADIRNTCTSSEDSRLFWFLNNGITIVCDSFDPVTDPDNPMVKVKNLQIVNGCQTATTLAQAAREGKLSSDVWVLLRIYEAPSEALVDKIVLTTNNQNRISSRDLRANDRVQIDMQERFGKFGLFYERKTRQFDTTAGIVVVRIAPNEIVAQSYLAVVLKKPSDARRRKYRVWGDLYDKIFAGQGVEPFVISYLLSYRGQQWLQRSGHTASADELLRRIANNGNFHIVRIASFRWRGSDDWSGKGGVFSSQVNVLENNASTLDSIFEDSIQALRAVIAGNSVYASDLDSALKSSTLDADIDKYLYQTRTSEKGSVPNIA